MTNEEILTKVIENAKNNGYKTDWIIPRGDAIYNVIFSHDFAKAFWGKTMVCDLCGDEGCYETSAIFPEGGLPMWKYNLREMVLKKEPIKYLELFL